MGNNLGLAHIGIFVKDLEASKKFYCEKLDFSIIYEKALQEDGGVTKIAFAQVGGCTLELIQKPVYERKTDGIVDHIAFKVKDIEKVADNLRKKGIVFETENITFVPDFYEKGAKWILFRGPDGEHLEITEAL